MNPEAEGFRLQQALDATRPDLQEAATAAHAKAWLGPYLRTQEGTRQLYSLLQQHVSKEAFLKQLTRARSQLSSAPCVTEVASAGQGEVLQPNGGWWQVPANEQTAHEPTCLELVEPDELSTPRSSADDYLASTQMVGILLFRMAHPFLVECNPSDPNIDCLHSPTPQLWTKLHRC